MSKLMWILREAIPGRSRRQWRYVSPRRHGVGMLLLALLLTATYGYWYFTNDARIRRTAEKYLTEATGWTVRIRKAHFSMFGGLQLQGVRVFLPDSRTEYPFLEADRVQMSHSPWRVLTGGGVKPTEIVCFAPVVTFEREQLQYQGGAKELLIGKGEQQANRDWSAALVPVRLREGRLQVVQAPPSGQLGAKAALVKSIPLNMSMLPQDQEHYRILFEERRPDQQLIQGSITINLRTGKTTSRAEGNIPSLVSLHTVLPPQYQQWLAAYSPSQGTYEVLGEIDGPETFFRVSLRNLTMTLPPEQGGFELADVCGAILFRTDRIEVKDLVGQVRQAPGARLKLSGEYNGYEETSPYRIELSVEDLDLPTAAPISGEVGQALAKVLADYQIKGRLTLAVQLARREKDRLDIRGSAEPKGLSLVYKYFPYPVSDVRGKVGFHNNQVDLENITARHDNARIQLGGKMEWVQGKQTYDIRIAAQDVPLDDVLANAIPKDFKFVYETIQPGGRTGCKVRVRRGVSDTQDIIDLDMLPDGHATMRHAVFPYPVENIAGLVRIADNVATIDNVTGGRGPMKFVINGKILDIHRKDCDVSVDIDLRDMLLDQTLQDALGGVVRDTVASLHPSGRAETARVELRQKPGLSMTYDIMARLKDVGLCYDGFPLPVTQIAGQLKVATDDFRLDDLVGRHGQAEIAGKLAARSYGKKLGLELDVSARDLEMNQEVFNALPPGVKRVWSQLSPGGKANLNLKLRSDNPDQPEGQVDYRLILHPQGMRALYSEFPYPFSNIRGEVVVVPGKAELKNMTAGTGDMSVWLEGTVLSGEREDQIELAIRAQGLPIDATLREAMPREVAGVLALLANGGTLGVDFPRLKLTAPAAQGPALPATAPGGEPASRPGPRQPLWSVDNGTISLTRAVLEGEQKRELSGRVTGSVARLTEGLKLSADMTVDTLSVLDRKLENIRGKLIKEPASALLRVDNLLATAQGGGRMAGFAEILFVDPLQYGLSLYVEDVPLAQIFPAASDKNAKTDPPEGLVSGNLQMTGSPNQPQQAQGTLRLSKAKLYKLPVLLGLLTPIYLSLPGETAFTDGHLTYRLKDNALVFDEIYLTGPSLSLVGSGRMDTRTRRVRLTFLTGPPGKMPRLRSLADELMKLIHKELVEIEISGSLDRPVTRTVPLRSVDALIRRITQPESKEGAP